ncbi:DUF418 domain-containing protein [Domibacillus epiphyticus]|uniref:DUF418 domain-containing protein n=1 Tax=Domibacillus epiphyticus TaxID=1714355 RepID=A0A1V2A7Y3_9BACI|nr:DUF418 domain-containing protein [Domibacillus epiphyticus]OMP67111.1 hypothetical protein BTO28_09025 [Domibacillus epiphyticus]
MQSLSAGGPKRIIAIDVLRGLSLFGIFLVNMLSFHSPYIYYNPYEWWKTSQDLAAFSWVDILVQSSFYPLFAMMFGFGAAMQYEKAKQQGQPFVWTGIRRFTFLMVLGLVHAFFIWPGDILFNYAVCGFLLLLFLRLSGRMLLIVGTLLLFLPAIALSLMLIMAAYMDPYSTVYWTDIASVSASIAAYGSGTYAEITTQRMNDWLNVNIVDGAFFYQLISILPFLFIGAGAYKLDIVGKWTSRPKKTAFIFLVFFVTGLLLKGVPTIFDRSNIAYSYIQDSIGGPILGVSYAALIILLCSFAKSYHLLKPFAAAGKMSLTNYLTQSIIGTLIFYHYGLGFYGQITVSTGIWLCVTIYAVQVIASNLWLERFQQGPFELLWRTASYGKRGKQG